MLRGSSPAGATVLHTWTDPPHGTRAELRRALADHGLVTDPGAELMLAVTLAATELLANARLHGRPPVQVQLLRTRSAIIFDVTDHDPGRPPAPAPPHGLPDARLGLHLVRTMATACGWYEALPRKHVWAAFDGCSLPARRPNEVPFPRRYPAVRNQPSTWRTFP